MNNEEWIALYKTIPEDIIPAMVIQLVNGTDICLDTIIHYQPQYLVARGRLGGTTDESRGFFIPYDQMIMLRWEKLVKLRDMQEVAGLERTAKLSILEAEADARDNPPEATPTAPVPAATPAAEQAAPAGMDTKTILEKIRAMRSAGSPGGPKPGGK